MCHAIVPSESGGKPISQFASHKTSIKMCDANNSIGPEAERFDVVRVIDDLFDFSYLLDTSTTSSASMKLVSLWLKNCDSLHGPCQQFRETDQSERRLPKRLINIQDYRKPFLSEVVHIHETSVKPEANAQISDEKYATLSYKWGSSVKYVTNIHNLTLHEVCIPTSMLPRTFVDAIRVAGLLGYSFLWIDALCIVQDLESDVAGEIEKMDGIFRHSDLTLFAEHGDSADSGLTFDRDPRWIKPCHLEVSCIFKDLHASGQAYYTIMDNPRFVSPLSSRGWVLQEEILSRRGLYFGNQLSWRCICDDSRESFPEPRGRVRPFRYDGMTRHESLNWSGSGGRDGFALLRLWLSYKRLTPNHINRNNQYDQWYAMIEKYSWRSLTYSADVLKALAGLARAFATTHECTYLSGLWKDDLQVGLCWYVVGVRKAIKSLESNGAESGNQVQNEAKLPSWSWSSHYGCVVKFRRWQDNNELSPREGVVPVHRSLLGPEHDDGHCNSFAICELVVRGPVRVARVYTQHYSSDERAGTPKWCHTLADKFTGELVGGLAFDFDPENQVIKEVHCLLVAVRQKYRAWQLTALALVPVKDCHGKYKRVGLALIEKHDWYGELLGPNLSKNDFAFRRWEARQFVRTISVQ